MQWLGRAVPMGPHGSIGFGAVGLGPVLGHPVFALVFGTPLAPNPHIFCHEDVTRLTLNLRGRFALASTQNGPSYWTARAVLNSCPETPIRSGQIRCECIP